MKKILEFDTETTGINEKINDIIQLSGLIIVGDDIKESFDFKMQPFSYENISEEALGVHGISIEEIKTFPEPTKIYRDFLVLLGKHCNKFDKSDKFYPAGYRVDFDLKFMYEWFKKNDDKYLGSWINWKAIDPLPYLRYKDYMGEISLPNYKLETVCEYFGIEIKAHDALSDIMATHELIKMWINKDI